MQTRRDFIKTGCACAAALWAKSLQPLWARETPVRKPNFIFILADDLGYGDLSATGQTRFQTPHIDALAQEGIRFNQFYSGSTVCAPSRCSLMTGLTMGHARVRGNEPSGDAVWPTGKEFVSQLVPLSESQPNIARLLKSQGYATGMFGKWGLGNLGSSGEPLKQGFDEFFGYLDQVHAHHYYVDQLVENDKVVPWDKTRYTHDAIWERGMEFVRKHRPEPFFLYLPVTLPHASMEVPEDSIKPFLDAFEEKPFPPAHYSGQTHPAAAFAGMVTRLDRDVGRLMALLQELKLDGDTLVFFTSDNGPHNEGGHRPDYFKSSGSFRGIKRSLYEGGIHVPMFVRWPGKIAPATSNETPYAFWDVLPTVAQLAGMRDKKIPETDGTSMVPALLGKERKKKTRALYWESYEGGFKQAVRLGEWKGVCMGVDQPLELYHLGNDPEEKHILSNEDYPSVVAKLEKAMKVSRTESPIWKSGWVGKGNKE